MRKVLPWVLLAVVIVGCGKSHPVKVFVDPEFESGELDKIAVLPFSSALHHAADPDNVAPRTFDQLFRAELDQREDYQWISPTSVEYAVQREDLEEEYNSFVDRWRKQHEVDEAFLAKLGSVLQVDGVLLGVVELWQQDEVDVKETATPTTYVGATVTIFDVRDGNVLFEAADEDFLEGARSENRNQQIRRSGSGQIYSDPGGVAYKAPPPAEVAMRVARALASSIPQR